VSNTRKIRKTGVESEEILEWLGSKNEAPLRRWRPLLFLWLAVMPLIEKFLTSGEGGTSCDRRVGTRYTGGAFENASSPERGSR